MSPEPLAPEPLKPEPTKPEPREPAATPEPVPGAPGSGSPGRSRFPNLGVEIVQAARGVLDVLRGGPDWASRFDITVLGFVRSFLGPLLAAPFYVFASAMVTKAYLASRPVPDDGQWGEALWGAALAHGLDALGFPLLIALVAKPLRIAGGYTAFVIVTNWSSLLLNVLLALLSLLALLGHDGLEAFFLLTPLMLCLSVFLVWRTGRATLSYEAAPVLLVVVLSVASGAGAEKLAELLVTGS